MTPSPTCNFRPKDFLIDAVLVFFSLASTYAVITWIEKGGLHRDLVLAACVNLVVAVGVIILGVVMMSYLLHRCHLLGHGRASYTTDLIDENEKEDKRQD